MVGTQSGQKGGDDSRRIKKLIDLGQSGPDGVDRTKHSLVKWWHEEFYSIPYRFTD